MEDIIEKMKGVMGGDDKDNAQELMEKESKEPQHNGGNESITQWAQEEEAEPEHQKSTQDKSIIEWAQEEDAEPDFSIGPDGKLYVCDKPLGMPEDIIAKIQELEKAGTAANNAGESDVKVTVIKAIPEQGGEDDATATDTSSATSSDQ